MSTKEKHPFDLGKTRPQDVVAIKSYSERIVKKYNGRLIKLAHGWQASITDDELAVWDAKGKPIVTYIPITGRLAFSGIDSSYPLDLVKVIWDDLEAGKHVI